MLYKSKYEDAGLMFLRALAIKEKVYGQEHGMVAAALNNRALFLKEHVRR